MKDIVESCKRNFSSLSILSIAFIFLLLSDNNWKRYRTTVEAIEAINMIDFRDWRNDIFVFASDEADIYLKQIKASADSLLNINQIHTFDTRSKHFEVIYGFSPTKRKSYYYPELYNLQELIENGGNSHVILNPDQNKVLQFISEEIAKAKELMRVARYEQGPYLNNIIVRYDIPKLHMELSLSFLYLGGNNYRIHHDSDTLILTQNKIESNKLPPYGDWITSKVESSNYDMNSFESLDDDIFLEIKDKSLSEGLEYLKNKRDKYLTNISIFGLQINNNIILVMGPLALLYFYLNLFINLRDLYKLVLQIGSNDYVYWIIMHKSAIGTVSMLLSSFLPMVAGGWLLLEYLPHQSKILTVIIVFIYVLILSLAVWSFFILQNLRKIYNQPYQ